MIDIVLGFSLLFNPFGYQTPVYNIEVMHFGHQVTLASVDAAWDRAGAPWKGDPVWSWMPDMVPFVTRVMVAPFYYNMQDCQHQVEWAVVVSVDKQIGYTVMVNPELLGTPAFDEALEAAFSKEFQIMALQAVPSLRAKEGCSQ
jgi:hypothetical protein